MNFDIKAGRAALREIFMLLFGEIAFMNSLPTAQKTYGFPITKIERLILCRERVTFRSGAHNIYKDTA